jgi:gliding motility-associated-like protein
MPPSHGSTYLGMTAREDFTWEDVHSNLITPLSTDSCYIFKMDFAYQQYVAGYDMQPIILKIYGFNTDCDKNHLLWSSPPISNTEWQTYEFMIHPDETDITDLVLEVYYNSLPPYWGYILMDNIRINPTPVFELGNDTILSLCENDSLILNPGSGFTGYLWQDGSTGQTYTVDTTGLYWVQVFNSEGCSWTDSIQVTIGEYLPMVTEMFDSLIVCQGQSVSFGVEVTNGVEPYQYQWEDLPDTTAIVTVIADTTMFYYVTVTDNCGYVMEDSIKLVVKTGPDIDLGNDTLICQDGEYEIHAGGGYFQYLWQDGSTDSTLTINQPGTYWVMVTSIYGCTTTDSINITLYPALPLDLGNDTIACEGEQVTLYAGEGYVTYQWQDNSTGTEYTANTTGIYWVTVTDDKGCSATDSIVVTFLSQPEVDLGSDTTICSGEELILDAGDGFVNYLWQSGDTTQYLIVTQAGTYSVTVDNGCGEASDEIIVGVQPSPAPDLGPDTTICFGQSLVLEPEGQYVSIVWQDNSTLPFYVVTTTGLYTVEVENNFGCWGEDEVYVTVSHPEVNFGEDTHLCEGDSLILDAGEGFVSYLWQDNSTAQTYIVKTADTCWVMVKDEFGCEAKDTIEIVLYPYPTVDLGEDMEICSGTEVILTGPEGDYTYYWNGEPGGQSYTVNGTEYYSLSVVNVCDSVTDEILVTEIPSPEVYLGPDQVIVAGETITLDAGGGYDSYLWQQDSTLTGQFFIVSEGNIDPDNPIFYVDVYDGMCFGSDTILIELFEVWVPSVITPNGDDKNDMFKPDPERWQAVKRHRITVFNRWGELVWESEDFPSGWDGKLNGRYVAEGTYFWILDAYYGSNDVKKTLRGTLTVLK